MTVVHFLKAHWLLILALALLVVMSGSMLYFNRFLNALDLRMPDGEYFGSHQPVQIGVCLDSLVESRWFDEQRFWEREAKAGNFKLEVSVAHHSLERQIRQIKGFIRRQAQVVMVVPVSRSGLGDVLREAAQKGVKIILYDELTEGPADFYCGIDYEAAGHHQSVSLLERAGSGTYLQIRGPADSVKGENLASGQLKGLKSHSPHAVRLLTVTLTDWSPDQAVVQARSYIAHQELTGILAPNDAIAEAIRRFYHEQKRPLPFLAGLGGETVLKRRIQAGDPIVTWEFDYPTLARAALTVARQFCEGRQPEPAAILKYQSSKLSAYFLRGKPVMPQPPEMDALPKGFRGQE